MNALTHSKPRVRFEGLDRESYLMHLKSSIEMIPGFSCAYLFGSFARNEDTDWSDIDLAIILKDEPDLSLEKTNPEIYWMRMKLVSSAISHFKDIDFIVYAESQWTMLIEETNPLGFWKELRRDKIRL
ncbi:nucleotidyltransferase domain-containing protein [Leptospira ognonensis]|uniref:Nucleotidyltransferase domain-containing protein n=1 Tax=Leptospira ognonensis TaxID=2484945 RepID=A0A4R9K0P2_9LEPT|nr:nucleotidyltransferase domain-containing protein [Leptospira ognonensis]TGL58666.1 nucleotidyltransferase domain-containing protein [Leptospira ognonensis]